MNGTVVNWCFTALNSILSNNYSLVIKLLATVASGIPSLNASCPNPATPNVVAAGMTAWVTHAHPTNTGSVAITETPFAPASVTSGELAKLTNDCSSNHGRGELVVCPGCRLGGLATTIQ